MSAKKGLPLADVQSLRLLLDELQLGLDIQVVLRPELIADLAAPDGSGAVSVRPPTRRPHPFLLDAGARRVRG